LLYMIYRKCASMRCNIDAMHGVQKVVYYMLMHELTIIALKPFTNLPLAFFSI
jgi:hypothetical protein